jgi:hypothetical protein
LPSLGELTHLTGVDAALPLLLPLLLLLLGDASAPPSSSSSSSPVLTSTPNGAARCMSKLLLDQAGACSLAKRMASFMRAAGTTAMQYCNLLERKLL